MKNSDQPTNRKCIIKSDFDIFIELQKRIFKDLNLSTATVAHDALKHRVKIDNSALCKYWGQFDLRKRKVKYGIKSSLSQENILWLCERYGITVEVNIDVLPVSKSPYYIDNVR